MLVCCCQRNLSAFQITPYSGTGTGELLLECFLLQSHQHKSAPSQSQGPAQVQYDVEYPELHRMEEYFRWRLPIEVSTCRCLLHARGATQCPNTGVSYHMGYSH